MSTSHWEAFGVSNHKNIKLLLAPPTRSKGWWLPDTARDFVMFASQSYNNLHETITIYSITCQTSLERNQLQTSFLGTNPWKIANQSVTTKVGLLFSWLLSFLGPWGRNRNTKQMPTCRWCHQCRRCLQSTHSPSQRVILFWNLRRMNQHSPINIHLYLPSLSFKERILCVFWRETRAMFLAFWPNFAPISPPSSPLQHSTWQCHHPSNPPQQCRSISVDVDAQPPPHLVSGVKTSPESNENGQPCIGEQVFFRII